MLSLSPWTLPPHPPSSEKLLARRTRLALNSALLLLNAARLPRACAPVASPRASDLSAPV
jgi:hypothetical protein